MTVPDVLRIGAAFGLDLAGAAAGPLDGGYSNESWRVDAVGGSYVVRRYGRLYLSAKALAFEHAIIEHASARMAEVYAPLRDPAGASYRLDDGAFVAVFPWVDGTTGARDRTVGVLAARTLAAFHRAGRDVHVAGGTRSSRFLGIVPWLCERFKRFAAAGSPVARALPWDDLIVALGASAMRVAPLAAQLPSTIVHGDPNPGNVVVGGGAVRALIDFDFAGESERIADVGAFVDEFARDDDDGALDLARAAALVDAYAQAAPLNAAERRLLPDAMLRHAATLVWYIVTRHGERAPGNVGGAPRYARRVSEIAANLEALRASAKSS
jgi:homoserine kinase type II